MDAGVALLGCVDERAGTLSGGLIMPQPLPRRHVLALAAAALCGTPACARLGRSVAATGPAASAGSVIEFGVTTVLLRVNPGHPSATQTVGGYVAAQTAATAAWWHPVLDAFKAGHRGLRAQYVAPGGVSSTAAAEVFGPGTSFQEAPNPQVSCRVGDVLTSLGRKDLSTAIRDVNLDTETLLPGVLAACTGAHGEVWGLPVDVAIGALGFNAAGLQSAGVRPPAEAGWTAEQLQAAAVQVAAHSGHSPVGAGLAWADGGTGPVWFGYLRGYGGSLLENGQVALTSGPGLSGLQAYAAILGVCWDPAEQSANARAPWLAFRQGVAQVGGPRWPQQGLCRFPEMPGVAAVPASPLVASVPVTAPQPQAGVLFVTWLLTPDGQTAITGLGYPAMRADMVGGASWLSKQGTGTRPHPGPALPAQRPTRGLLRSVSAIADAVPHGRAGPAHGRPASGGPQPDAIHAQRPARWRGHPGGGPGGAVRRRAVRLMRRTREGPEDPRPSLRIFARSNVPRRRIRP